MRTHRNKQTNQNQSVRFQSFSERERIETKHRRFRISVRFLHRKSVSADLPWTIFIFSQFQPSFFYHISVVQSRNTYLMNFLIISITFMTFLGQIESLYDIREYHCFCMTTEHGMLFDQNSYHIFDLCALCVRSYIKSSEHFGFANFLHGTGILYPKQQLRIIFIF